MTWLKKIGVGMTSVFKKYLLSGLLVWLPIWVTLLIVDFMINIMDKSLTMIPEKYQPDQLIGFHIPGLGLIFTLLLLFLTGIIVTNFLGRWVIKYWDHLIARIPLVRSIYSATKKIAETMFSSKGQSFRKVLLVEYPRRGMWSIAFQSAGSYAEIEKQTGEEMVTIFIPTTPNPTSGFLMIVPKKDVIELEMSVDQAVKFIISLGVVQNK